MDGSDPPKKAVDWMAMAKKHQKTIAIVVMILVAMVVAWYVYKNGMPEMFKGKNDKGDSETESLIDSINNTV